MFDEREPLSSVTSFFDRDSRFSLAFGKKIVRFIVERIIERSRRSLRDNRHSLRDNRHLLFDERESSLLRDSRRFLREGVACSFMRWSPLAV